MTYRFVAETPRLAKLSQSFSTRDEALQFARDNWMRMKRSDVRVCRVMDDAGNLEVVWIDPRELPEGYYGVDGKRYYLSAPKDGHWEGWVFLSTGSDYHNRRNVAVVRPDGTRSLTHWVLDEICKDPSRAAAEYGRITGVCRSCGRKLEDPESRARGMGPICAKRWGLA